MLEDPLGRLRHELPDADAERLLPALGARLPPGITITAAEPPASGPSSAWHAPAGTEPGPGKTIGRQRSLSPAAVEQARRLRAAGKSWSEIAREVCCSPWVAMRAAG